jgi:RNA polymerase sigma-70 factor, ECF subfamily
VIQRYVPWKVGRLEGWRVGQGKSGHAAQGG